MGSRGRCVLGCDEGFDTEDLGSLARAAAMHPFAADIVHDCEPVGQGSDNTLSGDRSSVSEDYSAQEIE